MFEFMLCKSDVEKFLTKAKATGSPIYKSPKLDGVRNLAVVEFDGDVKYWSRGDKEFLNFKCFDNELKELADIAVEQFGFTFPVMFDGEATDKTGEFSKIMCQVHRIKDVDNSLLRFRIFDIISELNFHNRYLILTELFRFENFKALELVPHEIIAEEFCNVTDIDRIMFEHVAEGHEGIVIKLATSAYDYKKSISWCKVKPFDTVDLRVTGTKMGSGKHAGKVGALLCNLKGVEISVGSGFSDEERVEFLTDRPQIIEVKYQPPIMKSGSLRFPTFLRVRNDKLVAEGEAA